MRPDDPFRKRPDATRPRIWISGGQRPPFGLRALGRAGLVLSRRGVAPILGWAAHGLRRLAEAVRDGRGRLPEARLGRAARVVPSHQRVAGWTRNLAATLAHASATADPEVKRGNALVATVDRPLWEETPHMPDRPAGQTPPVVLHEPMGPAGDPLAAIRGDLSAGPEPAPPAAPPAPPGPVTTGAIQVLGYLLGWAATGLALPYGLGRALWVFASGRDLREIGREES